MTDQKLRSEVRWLIRSDVPEVLQIDKLSFEIPLTEEDLNNWLRERNCIGMIIEHGDKLVGFMIYLLLKHRFDMIRFAVHPYWRRCGFGSKMINNLRGKLKDNIRNRITADVSEKNTEAHLFAKVMGFRAISIVKNTNEDDMYRFVCGKI